MLNQFKNSMKDEFDMTDLGKMRYFLGIEVIQKDDDIFIFQKRYAAELIDWFGIQHYNSVCNPIVPGQKIGSLMYLTAIWPDLMFVVSLISCLWQIPLNFTWQHQRGYCDT